MLNYLGSQFDVDEQIVEAGSEVFGESTLLSAAKARVEQVAVTTGIPLDWGYMAIGREQLAAAAQYQQEHSSTSNSLTAVDPGHFLDNHMNQ